MKDGEGKGRREGTTREGEHNEGGRMKERKRRRELYKEKEKERERGSEREREREINHLLCMYHM